MNRPTNTTTAHATVHLKRLPAFLRPLCLSLVVSAVLLACSDPVTPAPDKGMGLVEEDRAPLIHKVVITNVSGCEPAYLSVSSMEQHPADTNPAVYKSLLSEGETSDTLTMLSNEPYSVDVSFLTKTATGPLLDDTTYSYHGSLVTYILDDNDSLLIHLSITEDKKLSPIIAHWQWDEE